MPKPRIMIWVESHSGVGHMQKISQLSRELCKSNFEVLIASGSFDIGKDLDFGDAKLVSLERLSAAPGKPIITTSDGTFNVGNLTTFMHYLDTCEEISNKQSRNTVINFDEVLPESSDPDVTWKIAITNYLQRRQTTLRRTLDTFKPDVVLTEFWPAGRPGANVELTPFMEYIKAKVSRPMVVAMERDVLLSANPGQASDQSILEKYNRFFDLVLVAGNESLIRYDDTFPLTSHIKAPLRYTGYFSEPIPPKNSAIKDNDREVLISSGGGFTPSSKEFYEAAIQARKLSVLKNRPWRVLVSNQCPDSIFKAIRILADTEGNGQIIVERNRPDFKQLLADAAFSISRGGYNTTLEVALSGVPALIIPEVLDYGEEQAFRSGRFQKNGYCTVMPLEHAQSPGSLASEIDKTYLCSNQEQRESLSADGAAKAVEIIGEQLKLKQLNTVRAYSPSPSN